MAMPFEIIQLDKPRKIRFGMKALKMAEKMLGKSITKLGDDVSIESINTLLYCGLVWEDETLTPQKVEDLIDNHADNLKSVMNAVTSAINAAFGTPKNGQGPTVENGTGMNV